MILDSICKHRDSVTRSLLAAVHARGAAAGGHTLLLASDTSASIVIVNVFYMSCASALLRDRDVVDETRDCSVFDGHICMYSVDTFVSNV